MSKRLAIMMVAFAALSIVSPAQADYGTKVIELTRTAKQTFGSRYAGVWMDPDNSTKVRLGVSPFKTGDLQKSRQILLDVGLIGGIAGVPRPQSELNQANQELEYLLMTCILDVPEDLLDAAALMAGFTNSLPGIAKPPAPVTG